MIRRDLRQLSPEELETFRALQVQALGRNQSVSPEEMLVLLEKWRDMLWLGARNIGEAELTDLIQELKARGIEVPTSGGFRWPQR